MTERCDPPQEPGQPGPHGKPEPADRALTPRKFYKAEQVFREAEPARKQLIKALRKAV